MLLTQPPIRSDAAGDGHYLAPRGDEVHTGTDFAIWPGSYILAPESGRMGRYGWAYESDAQWRIVDFYGDSGKRYRFFYTTQDAYKQDDEVEAGCIIAVAQDIRKRYPSTGMMPHVHCEVFDPAGNRLDPARVLARL